MDRKTELPSLKGEAWLQAPCLQNVMRVLSEGGEVRVVGGAVRNSLLGVAVADIDLATTHIPPDVIRLCSKANFGVHLTGFDHGTITITLGGGVFEVTTMNALYSDASGNCYDYTNGYDDLLKHKVRFVGAPLHRIGEDYLRILRFFRFHATFGEGSPDRNALAACAHAKHGLKNLSAERIRQELLKLLVAPRAIETLKLMSRKNILGEIIPHTDNWRILERLPRDAVLRLFALAKQPLQLREQLRLSNVEAKRIDGLLAAPSLSPAFRPQEQRAMLYAMGASTWTDAVHMDWAQSKTALDDSLWQELLNLPQHWTIPEFPVKGNHLKSIGITSGPMMGLILRELEDWWLASDFKPGKDELLERARTNHAI